MTNSNFIVTYSDPILVTGSNGFIGSRVVDTLLDYGFLDLQCLVRPSSNLTSLQRVIESHQAAKVEVIKGNLLSQEDCNALTGRARIIYHLAAGRGDKSFANAYLNSVVTTKNLLVGASLHGALKRFVNISSFSVYSNWKLKRGGLLDETCDIETGPEARGEAYCYAKVRQEEIAVEYCKKFNFPYVILRPGVVYGPGNKGIHGRIGIGTFGIFLHLGGSNRIPLSYVDNCAEAIVRAGIVKGVDGEIFNVVDDDLPTSRKFLGIYKKNVADFRSVFVPYRIFYQFCHLWESYSKWSQVQLPPVFNRKMCSNYWKGNRYSNEKLKSLLQWKPKVGFKEAAMRYCEYQKACAVRK
ncbi:MAG: NAD(P)-dependent oxidoreductase [Nitrospirae bacterium]|nr:NAD(P)-dependent oxidoreductase [Nitrospirota bacterium]